MIKLVRHLRVRTALPRWTLLPGLALLALLLGACAQRTPVPEAATSQRTSSLQALIDTTLVAPSDAAAERVLAALGEPLRRQEQPVANLHDPRQLDRVDTLVYDGARATIYRAFEQGRSFLLELEVTADSYATPEGIGIGSRRDEVAAAFGERLLFAEGGAEVTLSPAGDSLRLVFGGERVVRMVWRFYAD